jgi:hypothetical protein
MNIARHGMFTKPMSLSVCPTVELTQGVFTKTPQISTSNTNTVHHGIYIALQRGGAGYVMDYIVEVSIKIRFIGFDGK